MKTAKHHIMLPALMPLLFFAVAATPVDLIGCRNRGLAAFAIAFCSGLAAMGTALTGIRARIKNHPRHFWWMVSTVILTIPVVALIILA